MVEDIHQNSKGQIGIQTIPIRQLFVEENDENGFVAIGIYVDDCLMIWRRQSNRSFCERDQKYYDITTEDVHDFVVCTIKKKESAIYLHQPDLIKKMLKTFGNDIEKLKDYETPPGPGYRVTRPHTDEEKLNNEEQKKYRSGVWSLLYLVKHSRPDLLNSVRELSKVMDGANEGPMKAMLRAIKYVEVTRNLRLK